MDFLRDARRRESNVVRGTRGRGLFRARRLCSATPTQLMEVESSFLSLSTRHVDNDTHHDYHPHHNPLHDLNAPASFARSHSTARIHSSYLSSHNSVPQTATPDSPVSVSPGPSSDPDPDTVTAQLRSEEKRVARLQSQLEVARRQMAALRKIAEMVRMDEERTASEGCPLLFPPSAQEQMIREAMEMAGRGPLADTSSSGSE